MPARQRHKQERQRVFQLFRQLPTEVRLKIWVHTWEPRTVSLYPSTDDGGSFLRPGTKNRLPASGYVNSESRSETLRYYKPCFANRDKTDFRWFNFRLDTLCLASDEWFLDKLDPSDARQVQRLILPETFPGVIRAATPCRDTWPKPVTESFEAPIIKELLEEDYPNLKEITLTTNRWWVSKRYSLEKELEKYDYLFEPQASLYKGWC
ncbi:hypothetical protein F4823DRAFT_613198 [Ustulina deusta]|nr:hypothetical protein F4823DRAFT_613198 [Ustulina deusta]